jgi:hypothetical protein
MNFYQSTLSRTTIAVAACVVTGSASALMYGGGPAESWTIGEIASMTTSVATNITSFGAAFGANMALKYEQVISAIAVATKQESLAGVVVADGVKDSAEQLVNAVRAQNLSDQATKAYLNYNPSTAQGYQPCLVAAKNRTLDSAFRKLETTAFTTVSALDVAPGHLVGSTGTAMAQRLADHRSKFCSKAEADAGICTLSALPGGDVNASLLFEPTAPGSLKQEAQAAFMQHVLGAPDQAIPATAGMTPAGQQYMLAKNNKDALLSIPAYSLSMIRAANTQETNLGNKSPNEVLKIRVNQYFGGKEAKEWSNVLTAQSERGLMVEAVKMGGLEVWLHHKQYQQNQRLEMNLAALAMASAQESKASVDAKYEKMMRDTAARAIK